MAADQVLRSDGSAWKLDRAVLSEGGLAAQTSMPREAMDRLKASTGEQADEIAIASLAEPPLIVTASAPLPAGLQAHAQDGFAVLDPSASIPDTLATNPAMRVQDPTSAAALEAAASLHPDQVLDLCAGRGTKTRQLAAMFPEAAIYATEPNNDRRSSLRASTANLPQVTVLDPGDDGPGSPFDLVLADVPCSNSGVMARRPEARYRWDETREQHQLLFPVGLLVLNESGAAIVQLCDGRTTDEVICELESRVSNGNPADDVHLFLARLAEKGLLRDGNS